ncbi:SDR family oxidoreductase [Spirillospora sp. NPDC048911]|uniref:SDR family oxidoreductase n=1 Tax=Spirillospora sp. NPDC048911 TaxID=3364527 RepID=UPI0037139AF5
MTSTTHLVTGGTGMLGGALVLELLSRTEGEIWCLTRETRTKTAAERLNAAVMLAAEDQDRLADLERLEAQRRLRAVPGDITAPRGGLAEVPRPAGRIHLWHSAAALFYEPGFAAESYRSNVIGTAEMILLAREWGAELTYVSTAYVAGCRKGLQYEALPPPDQPVNNIYERSKICAELLVAGSGLCWRILRPSAVVAAGATLRTRSSSGLYDVAAKVGRWKRQYHQRYGPLLLERPALMCGHGESELNLVPLDHVVGHGVTAALEGPPRTVYHLVNEAAPTVKAMYSAAFTHAGLPPPEFVGTSDQLQATDRLLANALAFHVPYTCTPKTFDTSHTAALVGGEAMKFPLPERTIRTLLERQVEQPGSYPRLTRR